uniref:Uncharacterized protein n=1 Tax=Onchocerca volvulus TaxID=6282 RepID=A0A8R1TW37_ONCVO
MIRIVQKNIAIVVVSSNVTEQEILFLDIYSGYTIELEELSSYILEDVNFDTISLKHDDICMLYEKKMKNKKSNKTNNPKRRQKQ